MNEISPRGLKATLQGFGQVGEMRKGVSLTDDGSGSAAGVDVSLAGAVLR